MFQQRSDWTQPNLREAVFVVTHRGIAGKRLSEVCFAAARSATGIELSLDLAAPLAHAPLVPVSSAALGKDGDYFGGAGDWEAAFPFRWIFPLLGLMTTLWLLSVIPR